jgi:hypothetical protein
VGHLSQQPNPNAPAEATGDHAPLTEDRPARARGVILPVMIIARLRAPTRYLPPPHPSDQRHLRPSGGLGPRRQQLDAVRSGKFRDSGWVRPGRLRQYKPFGWLPHVGDECVETGRAKDQQSAALAELGHLETVRHASVVVKSN